MKKPPPPLHTISFKPALSSTWRIGYAIFFGCGAALVAMGLAGCLLTILLGTLAFETPGLLILAVVGLTAAFLVVRHWVWLPRLEFIVVHQSDDAKLIVQYSRQGEVYQRTEWSGLYTARVETNFLGLSPILLAGGEHAPMLERFPNVVGGYSHDLFQVNKDFLQAVADEINLQQDGRWRLRRLPRDNSDELFEVSPGWDATNDLNMSPEPAGPDTPSVSKNISANPGKIDDARNP